MSDTPGNRLEHFPVSFFAVTMGLFGLALALRAGGLGPLSALVGLAGVVAFGIIATVFILKGLCHPTAMKAEWHHPVRLAFFPAMTISLLLLATLLRDLPWLARPVWLVGALGHAVLTVVVVEAWIGHRRAFGPGHLSPAWFIPAVGNVVAPLAGVPLGYTELSWYFFAVGLLFWLILLTLVVNRLMFHDPMPGKLRPTLVILIAPPAVAFLSWVLLHGGEVDGAARMLINAGYFFTLVVAVQARSLLALPFALSFWALSFPLAAMSTASFRFAELTHSGLHRVFGYLLLALLVAVVGTLLWRTAKAMRAGEICVPE